MRRKEKASKNGTGIEVITQQSFSSDEESHILPNTVAPKASHSTFAANNLVENSYNEQHLPDTSIYKKQRLRVSKACDRCRSQKIKCSGSAPCTNCQKHRKQCTFSGRNFYPDKKKGRVDMSDMQVSPGLTVPKEMTLVESSYLLSLENRVHYLEAMLQKTSASSVTDVDIFVPEINTEHVYGFRSVISKWREQRRFQNILVNELCFSLYKNLKEENKLKVQLPRYQFFGWNMSGIKYFDPGRYPDIPVFELPAPSTFYIDYFFREINPLYAIIHEDVFREQLVDFEKMKEELASAKPGKDLKANQTRLFEALLYLVYVLAIRFTEFVNEDGPNMLHLELEVKLFKYCYKLVNLLSFQWNSFELIQAWLLITLYLRVTHAQNSASMSLGRALSMVKAMGVYSRYSRPDNATNYELLKAKRVFWSTYALESMFSLQIGTTYVLSHTPSFRNFPSYDFEAENDSWLTLPALAMILLSEIASEFNKREYTLSSSKVDMLNRKFERMKDWLDRNGFADKDIFNTSTPYISSPLIKAQVKLRFYDLILCLHGTVLFNYLGKIVPDHGYRLDFVSNASKGITSIMSQIDEAGLLYVPWALNLMLPFNVGVMSICMIHGGYNIMQAKEHLKISMKLIEKLKDSPVKDENGNIIQKSRFTMAEECNWALKMCNRILTLRLKEDYEDAINIGIDHGSGDVNNQKFQQLGPLSQKDEEAVNKKLFADGSNDTQNTIDGFIAQGTETLMNDNVQDYVVDNEIDMLGNLQWFDQWMNFHTQFN